MKLTTIAAALALTIGLGVGHARAQGIPVIDATGDANEIIHTVDDATQIANQATMILNQTVQYEQMVKNATSLPGMVGLLSQFGLSPSDLTSEQLSMVMNDVYALNADSTTWQSDMTRLLSTQGWTLPQSPQAVLAQANSLYAGAGAATITAGYSPTNRDFAHYSAGAQQMSNLVNQEGQVMGGVQSNLQSAQGLQDTSEVASLHALNVGQAALSRQQDLTLKMQQIVADAALQRQLKDVETDTQIAQETLDADAKKQVLLQTPITPIDMSAFQQN
ncbi:MAG TPA: hypothetical protein VGU69_10395 [Rhizomicrobium sp.]|nr:hypothetical protein [Rhizomicrobium sp.]